MNYLNKCESAQRRDERDRMLTMLYCEIYDSLNKKNVSNSRQVALELAINNGAPPYNVGFDRAYVVIPKLLRHEPVHFHSEVNKLMWLDITHKVKSIVSQGKMSIAQAIPIVLEQCKASRFFLTKQHAWVIIKRTLSAMNIRRPYGRVA
ncbi:MAG: hypothetical protein IKS64_04580 [Muribaculaceae bacterium]|nr:hypothetical protein [Muribaculaceae bacterium]MBR6432109.1 hypothetical protein [Muribaculaceae bacterium]